MESRRDVHLNSSPKDCGVGSKQLTVLHVIETLARGGAEQLLVTLLPELVRQGVNAEVVVLRGPYDLEGELERAGVVVHRLKERRKWAIVSSAVELAKLAKVRQADILHAHLYFPISITATTKILGLFKGVTHASFHNLAYGGANKRTWKLWLRQKLSRFLVRRGIDQPQAVSKASEKHFITTYGRNDVKVIYNAVDLGLIGAITASANDAIVLPGRLVKEKGHLDLIRALELLEGPCPEVVFAGDGPMRPTLEDRIKSSELPVTISGRLSHHEMLKTIRAARLVVIPSRYEGFGLTALEALALGRPVVSTTAGGLPEVMGELGSLVPPADPSALALALSQALTDHEWRKTQERHGPPRAAQFSVEAIASQQIALYRQTLKSKNTGQ